MVIFPAHSPRIPRAFRGIVSGILVPALLCLLLSACSFLTSDMFPSWLSYADASLDLRGLVRGFGVVDEPENLYAEYLQTTSGNAYIAVLYAEDTSNRLVILDPDDMSVITTLKDASFTSFLAADCAGNIVCGTSSISDSDSFTTLTPLTVTLSYGTRQWLVRYGTTPQYIAQCDGTTLYDYKYESDWASGGPIPASIGIFADPDYYPSSGWTLLDAESDDTGVGYWLFQNYGTTGNVGYVAHYSSSIEGVASSFLYNSAQVTGPFPVDEGLAWITTEGPVACQRSDKGKDRLVRYKLGTGALAYDTVNFVYNYTYSTELDSFGIDLDEMNVLSFDPSGTFWFAYNEQTGQLLKLRTWWK